MDYLIIIVGGYTNSLTPGGTVFFVVTVSLSLLGIFLKKRILIYVSLFILSLVLLLHLSVPLPLIDYIGSIQGLLITSGNYSYKLIHNFGFIFVPLVIGLVALRLSSKRT